MILRALLILGMMLAGSAARACVPAPTGGASQTVINALLQSGGAGTVVALCPRTVYPLTAPVVFTAPDQELSTQGAPPGPARAVLRVEGADQAMAILGQCPACSGLRIRNLQVDGNRPALGRLPKGGALIEIGGATSGQLVRNVHAFEPRGWSALHVFEGALDCRGAQVLDNQIGPSGQPDGAWADGISYACRDGQVAGNTVTDATDGGIVIFQAPGTLVEHNTIVARTRTLMGGINMVDYKPYDGDYSGTVVRDNRIEAQGAMIKVGLAVGPAVWGLGQQAVQGGTVEDNRVEGAPLGYGLAVGGVSGFTIGGNIVTGAFAGHEDVVAPGNHDPYPKCGVQHPNPAPQAAVISLADSIGDFGAQRFVAVPPFAVLICLQPAGQTPGPAP
jgi:hypothetical protein